MFDLLQRLMSRLRIVWDSMTLNQKVISGGVLVALLIAFAYMTTLRDTLVNYTVLFTELDSRSASQIITELDQRNVPYRLSNDGRTIEVPDNVSTELKIDLTAEGLPESGIVGFEILDTTTFGMSERIQEVQIQRALQGELSKALVSIDAIEGANVTLSIPEQTLFSDYEEPTTAAVILRLRRIGALSDRQVQGLTNLIASAVPGLMPDNVSIMDTQGNALTRNYQDETAMLSSTQWEFKMNVDRYLAAEAKRILDGAYGVGKSIVTVNAELDWDHLERMTTEYDEETSAVTAEESFTATEPTPDGVGEQERIAANYEPGQRVESFAKNTGDIERLTVSVFIDHRDTTVTDEDGEDHVEKIPFSEEEIASIRAVTENAVGFNGTRGDQIEVIQMAFTNTSVPLGEGGFTIRAAFVESVRAAAMGLAILAAIGVLFYILRVLTSALDPSKITMKAEEEIKKHRISFEDEEKLPDSDRDVLVRKIVKSAAENPEIAAKTIKSLFRSD